MYLIKVSEYHKARLLQSVERKAFNLVVMGSSPTVGAFFTACCFFLTCFSNIISFHIHFRFPVEFTSITVQAVEAVLH